MGFLSKSKIHKHNRKEKRHRHDVHHYMEFQEKQPKQVLIDRDLTKDEIRAVAEQSLRDKGIFPPEPVTNRSCEKEATPDTDGLMNGCKDGANAGFDIMNLTHPRGLKKTFGIVSGCATGMVGYLWSNVQKETSCLSEKKAEYDNSKLSYDDRLQSEINRTHTVEKTWVTVGVQDPLHPAYDKYKPRPPEPSFGGSIYSDGRTHGARFTWNF